MILVKNPTENDLVDFNYDFVLYTIKAGTSERLPDNAATYMCKHITWLVNEGKCIEHKTVAEKTEEVKELAEVKKCDLGDIHGLGEKSVEKLIKAEILTKEEFNKLTNEELTEIVGSLVASKFK